MNDTTIYDIVGWRVEEIEDTSDFIIIDFRKGKDRIRLSFPTIGRPEDDRVRVCWNP